MWWSKQDSLNLESIAKSLESIAEREKERELVPQDYQGFLGMFKQRKKAQQKEIEVFESKDLEEIAEDEIREARIGIAEKIKRAEANNQAPFFVEDMLSAEELESL